MLENAKEYWSNRWKENQTGWDIGYSSSPLTEYFDQLKNKDLKILIPGAGNGYEAEYLFKKGFKNVFILDIASEPLRLFKNRVPDFPADQLLNQDFFKHNEQYDLIIEQTFFCSFPPTSENRKAYAHKMSSLLNKDGKLVGLWFSFPLKPDQVSPPYGGSITEYSNYFSPFFQTRIFEECHNSIKPRSGNELFGIFIKQ